jgi:hypothetical protein
LINLDAAGKGKEPAAREMDTLGSAQRGVTGGSEMYPIGQIDSMNPPATKKYLLQKTHGHIVQARENGN